MLASPLPTVLASPRRPHGRHAFVQGVEPGIPGHVTHRAIAEIRDHRQTLFLSWLHEPVVRDRP